MVDPAPFIFLIMIKNPNNHPLIYLCSNQDWVRRQTFTSRAMMVMASAHAENSP
jgi:hypothetical protein